MTTTKGDATLSDTQGVTTDPTPETKDPETTDLEKGKDDEKKEEEEEVPNLGGRNKLMGMYGKDYCCYLVIGLFVASLNGCVMPLFGTVFREITDTLFYSDNLVKETVKVVMYYIAIGAGAAVFTVAQYGIWGYYGGQIGVAVRRDYFKLLLEQEVGYHDLKNSGKLNTKLVSESIAIQEGCGLKLGYALQQVVTGIFGMILAFIYSWEMTLVLMACIPVLIFVGGLQQHFFSGKSGGAVDPFVDAGSFSNEVLVNIKTVVALPKLAQSKIIEYANILQLAYPIARKRALGLGLGIGAMLFGMFGVMYAIGLWYGSILVDDGTISIGDMFGCYFSFLIAGMALGQLGSVLNDLKAADMAANIFLNLQARQPEIRPPSIPTAVKHDKLQQGKITFDNIAFSYPAAKDTVVLHDVSFEIASGSTVALVGPSGSGKSTVISLIERYYDPNEGSIKIDDQEIHNYDLKFLRSQIGYVSQLPLLFDASIKENIRAGNPNVSDEMIYSAASQADADEFIKKLPKQYDTKVGEMGGRLSGGQRQRICIARAIVTSPKILLLDEATSALDTKSEREVQHAIDKIAQTGGQTIVVIAHRLSTIKNADLIIVLVEGEIDERGNHNQLMNNNGVYSALVKSQALVEKHRQHSAENLIDSPPDYVNDIDIGIDGSQDEGDNNDNNDNDDNDGGGNGVVEEEEEEDVVAAPQDGNDDAPGADDANAGDGGDENYVD